MKSVALSPTPSFSNSILHKIGTPLYGHLEVWFEVARLFFGVMKLLFQPSAWRISEIARAITHIGIESIPMITVSTVSGGLVITKEIAYHMNLTMHTVNMVPGFTGQFVVREIGTAVPAMLLVAKAGAAMTAEIGMMEITEQVDALRLLGIQPISYLVFPRFIASIISGACLSLIAISITLSCGILVAITQFDFTFLEYLTALSHFVKTEDLFCALVKGSVYGSCIPLISCAYGLKCKGGAEGVGTATTRSVVSSTVAIIFLDLILTYIFSNWIF